MVGYYEFWCFRDSAEACTSVSPIDEDLLGAHSDVFRYCEKVRAAQSRSDYWVPLDLRLGGAAWDSEERTQAVLRQFGELLVEWPDIVEGARQLRQAGLRLSLPV
jgi:hypothetical protein